MSELSHLDVLMSGVNGYFGLEEGNGEVRWGKAKLALGAFQETNLRKRLKEGTP